MFQFSLVLKLNSENLIDPTRRLRNFSNGQAVKNFYINETHEIFDYGSCRNIFFFFSFSFLSRSLIAILRAITRHFTDHLFTVRNITVRLDKIIFPSGLWVVRTNDLYCRKKKGYRKVYSSFSLWEKNKTILYVKWIVNIRCIDDALLPDFEKIIMELDNWPR